MTEGEGFEVPRDRRSPIVSGDPTRIAIRSGGGEGPDDLLVGSPHLIHVLNQPREMLQPERLRAVAEGGFRG